MPTTRERLHALLDKLPDDQLKTVLSFAEALQRGAAVVSVCDTRGDGAAALMEGAHAEGRRTLENFMSGVKKHQARRG